MLFCCLDQFFPQLMFLFVKSSFVVVVQSLSHVWLFATPRTAVCQASLSFTTSRGSFKLMSIESVMLSNHLVLCRPLLLLPSIFPRSGSFLMSHLFASGGKSSFAYSQIPTTSPRKLFSTLSPAMLHLLPVDFLVDFHSSVNDLFSGLSGGWASWVLTLYLFCLFLCPQPWNMDLTLSSTGTWTSTGDRVLLN